MANRDKTILIIDCDIDFRNFAKMLFQNMGHRVYEADNIKDAITLIGNIVPHLILLDIALGSESGLNLFSKISDIDPHRYIKIVVASALNKEKTIKQSMSMGAHSYLVKPINNTQLITMLKKTLPLTELAPCQFPLNDESKSVIGTFMGQTTKINELGINIRSQVKFEEKQKLNVDSNFLKSLNMSHINFVISKKSFNFDPGIYDTFIHIIGLREMDLTSIRKLKTRKV